MTVLSSSFSKPRGLVMRSDDDEVRVPSSGDCGSVIGAVEEVDVGGARLGLDGAQRRSQVEDPIGPDTVDANEREVLVTPR
jgi:hypothetical protein